MNHQKNCLRLSVLSSERRPRMVEQALEVLETVGVRFEHAEALRLLRDAGQRVEGDRAFIRPDAVCAALASAPSSFALYDRAGELAFEVGRGAVAFDPGSAAVHLLDPETRRRREPVRADCVHLAWVTEACRHLAAQSTALVPTDVPPELADRVRLKLALEHGTKPIVTGTFTTDAFSAMRAMLVAVRGGDAALRERPLAIFDCCPTPPLGWSELTVQTLIDCARAGIPATLVSVPLAGATAPVTLREVVVQHAAENLSGLVVHQLAAPGAPVVYGGSPAAFDMRHGTTPMAAIETVMIQTACSDVGHHLGLPTHGYLGLADAKLACWQAGAESATGAVLAALSGLDIVSGAGMLDFESCQSLEKLVLDNEACGMAHRLARGISSTSAGESVSLIREVATTGQALSSRHTRAHFRDELLFPGRTIDRATYGDWEQVGALDSFERARIEVRRIIDRGAPAPLDPDLARALVGG